MFRSVYNLADAGETPAKLHSNWKWPISHLKHLARSYDRTSYVILYTDLTPMCTITHKRISCNKSQWMEIPVSKTAPESWSKLLIFFLLYLMLTNKTSRTGICIHSIFNEPPFRFITNHLTNQQSVSKDWVTHNYMPFTLHSISAWRNNTAITTPTKPCHFVTLFLSKWILNSSTKQVWLCSWW